MAFLASVLRRASDQNHGVHSFIQSGASISSLHLQEAMVKTVNPMKEAKEARCGREVCDLYA